MGQLSADDGGCPWNRGPMLVGVESVQSFGEALAAARRRRKYSQLRLSQIAAVSARHLSFLETGRAFPSRKMVLRLSAALGLGETEVCALLQAAGYATEVPIPVARSHVPGMASFDMDTLYAIEDADELESAIALAAAALGRLGISQFFLGTMSLRSTSLAASIRHHDLSHAPLGWMAHYKEQGYGAIDPLLVATASQHLPFYWSEVFSPRLMADPSINRMVREAADFGITNGYVASIRRSDGRVHAISCMADRLSPKDPAARSAARAVSTALLHKADEGGMPERRQNLRLDAKHASILQSVLNGLDSEATAARHGLSDTEWTSEVARLCRLFGTSDVLDAALRARRYDLVQI